MRYLLEENQAISGDNAKKVLRGWRLLSGLRVKYKKEESQKIFMGPKKLLGTRKLSARKRTKNK